jgi:ABC-type dipeptide/oligopeptide/nickel transport system permease subunit
MGETMATPKTRIASTVKALKNFLKTLRKNKRGTLGFTIIIFYVFVALTADIWTPYDPESPRKGGYYPASRPPIATRLAKPFWMKYLPGGENMTENLDNIVPEYQFSSPQALEKWRWTTPENTKLEYTDKMGTRKDRPDGSVKITYKRDAETPPPGNVTVSLYRDFEYPFNSPPKKFTIHTSIFVNGTLSHKSSVSSMTYFYHKNQSYPLANFIPEIFRVEEKTSFTRNFTDWKHIWISSGTRVIKDRYRGLTESIIFPKAGNYTYKLEIIFNDENPNEKTEIIVYLDNLQILFYGEIFGFLGTDGRAAAPRDIFTTLIHGTRVSLMVGLLSAFFSVTLGLFLGLVSGYVGGATDELIMRFADFLLVLPTLPLLIVIIVVTSPSIWNLIFILSLFGWMGFSRTVRSLVLSLRERPFVEAAKAVGASKFYIIRKHILPNVFAFVYITLATFVPGAIIAEASLSWLGLFDPTVVSWGRMLQEFTTSGVINLGITEYWFWVIPPGVAIAVLALAFILLGFALDELLNPKLRKRQ